MAKMTRSAELVEAVRVGFEILKAELPVEAGTFCFMGYSPVGNGNILYIARRDRKNEAVHFFSFYVRDMSIVSAVPGDIVSINKTYGGQVLSVHPKL